jgi:hypothetical protein
LRQLPSTLATLVKKTPYFQELTAVANLMGHESSKTTEGYIGSIDQLEKEPVEKAAQLILPAVADAKRR